MLLPKYKSCLKDINNMKYTECCTTDLEAEPVKDLDLINGVWEKISQILIMLYSKKKSIKLCKR